MNPFSQSKLTLKLKKHTSSISTDSTNKYEKPEISESSKSEFLSSHSTVSENDSFVEILHTVQSHNEKIPTSQSVFKTSLLDQNISNKINEKKECPVCLLMLEDKSFINHIKSCGTSHNLSSKVLIKALNLQERQAAEREALGLPKCTKNQDVKKPKCRVNKQSKLKIGSDSNLDLAIAMSVSLQESKEAEIIKESETLLEAGLEKEALDKRKTLESFGFVSTQPVKSKPKIVTKTNSLLFKQTKEDREKRITEKVAMILIDSDIDTSLSETLVNHCSTSKLGSKYLNKIRSIDNTLWKKSLLDTESVNEFYVNNLLKFIKPCEVNHLLESNIDNKEFIDTLQTGIDNSNFNSTPIKSNNIVEKKTISDYSAKWKSMVGNQLMSDITIFVKDEQEIPAHSLVLHVQCPNILDDVIIEESVISKSKKMLMWLEYSYEGCLAFLKLIYSGHNSLISPEYRNDYLLLGARYNVLIAMNDDENFGWFSEEHCELSKHSKRKSQDLNSSPTDCKRYKASSPDMFISNDSEEKCVNTNFLGTIVNDEKSISVLKTQQWLDNCYAIPQNYLSFTENLSIDIPPLAILSEKSPSHSAHSALTVRLLPLSSPSNHSDDNVDLKNIDEQINYPPPDTKSLSPKSISSDGSSVKAILMLHKTKNISSTSTPSLKISSFTNVCKEPELITISDSDSGSVDMILPNNMKNYWNSNNICNNSSLNKNNCTPLSLLSRTKEKKNSSYSSINIKDGNNINTIVLNDDSSDSIHSACTNLLYPGNRNTIPSHSSCHDSSMSNTRSKNIICIDDESSVLSAATNVLHPYNSTQVLSNNNNNIIDLVEDSSDFLPEIDRTVLLNDLVSNDEQIINNSTSFSNIESHTIKTSSQVKLKTFDTTQYPSSSASNNIKANSLDPVHFSNNRVLHESYDNMKFPEQSFQLNNISSEFLDIANCSQINDADINGQNSNRTLTDKKNDLNIFCSTFKPLENTKENKTLIKLSINNSDLPKTSMEIADSCLSDDYINKDASIHPINIQDEQQQIWPYENDHKKDDLIFEQIIDDPWMNYLQPIKCSPNNFLSNSLVSSNESEVLTNKKTNNHHTSLDLKKPPSPLPTNSNGSKINYQKKNAVTPNKYGSRINTPKSLRRIRSESIIGSKEQVTPLPDYSSMKTPDFRREFDRYGLKDLGKRKGKLILRHIYDVLHPSYVSEEGNLELENYSDSSDSSEHGIPDYEGENYDELDTFSQINFSNKISVEIGFKQLLRVNENLHKKILCYEPIWIEDLKEELKQFNVNIGLQKLMTFLDDKCITFRSKSINDQKHKALAKRNPKRKKLF